MSTAYLFFALSGLAIGAGYIAVPIVVLRYLPLTRRVQILGAVFFAGSAGVYVALSLSLWGWKAPIWLFAVWYLLQVVGTWGFIITFRAMLRAATARRHIVPALAEPAAEIPLSGDRRNRPWEGGGAR